MAEDLIAALAWALVHLPDEPPRSCDSGYCPRDTAEWSENRAAARRILEAYPPPSVLPAELMNVVPLEVVVAPMSETAPDPARKRRRARR